MALTKQELEDYAKGFTTPWGEIGYITYKRTYARRLHDSNQKDTEEFYQTVARVVRACSTQLKVGFTEEEERQAVGLLMNLKGSVAGRFMWQLGTKTVGKLGLASLQNCAGCVVDDPIRPFTWTMDMLMLGCGVGVNIQREYVYQIPKLTKKKPKIVRIDNASADYIVPDTREGWVKLLGKTLKSYAYSGEGFTYSTQLIRGRGTPISAFGGEASGPEILVEGIESIIGVLEDRRGKKLRPIDALDIINIIGMIVVAGNIRRSAIIAIGDADDVEYLKAKRWDLGNIPKWRANSNNSVACSDTKDLISEFWEGYKGNGEPYGLINFDAARAFGRTGEVKYPDSDVVVFNPCFTGDTPLLTKDGFKSIESLVDKEVTLVNSYGEECTGKVWSNGVKETVNVTLSSGEVIGCTPDHRFMIDDGSEVLAKDLKGKRILPYYEDTSITSEFTKSPVVTKVESAGEEEVFDFNLDSQNHWGVVGTGYVAHNCGEQGLANYETCCLAEVYLPNITSYDEFLDTCKCLYRIAKHSLTLPCHNKETEAIVHKNMRMGIGVTGEAMATSEQKAWYSRVYEEIRKYDVVYSKANNFPVSIKIFTVKPAGTSSLLAGVTSGAHVGFSQYYIRRMRISATSPLVELCRNNGYPVEYRREFDGSNDYTTVVVSFPATLPDHAVLAKDVTAIDQLEICKRLQKDWSDNSVSVTVYYQMEELPAIQEWLADNYSSYLKTVSFLLHSDHGFDQAPMEEITKEEYEEMVSKTKPINGVSFEEEDISADQIGCASGACPIK